MRRYIEIMNGMAEAVGMASAKISTDFWAASRCLDVVDKDNKSGLPDFVTKTDIAAQSMIEESLDRNFPDIAFVGEEGKGPSKGDRPYFLVDPVDGTSNFVALRDYFACCAAYVESGDVKAAVIADPMRGYLIKAYKGGGCLFAPLTSPSGGERLQSISRRASNLRMVQLECELAMNKPHHFSILEVLMPRMSGMRKSGSTALDMANIAQGKKVVLISENLEPYDLAAGLLIVREAGGGVLNFNGAESTISSKCILSGALDNLDEVLRIIKNSPKLCLV